MTTIEWCDAVWNPVRGCSRVSPGCDNCYAMRQAHRFSGPGKPYARLTRLTKRGVDWSGVVRFIPEQLGVPLGWRKPRRVFVNSMSDLFHEALPNQRIASIFGVMAACPRHTFQVLTKRPERMAEWFAWIEADTEKHALHDPVSERQRLWRIANRCASYVPLDCDITSKWAANALARATWPLPNVWIGVSAENQKTYDERIRFVRDVPAAIHWLSLEPLLGPVDLTWAHGLKLDWIVVGGESGPRARLSELEHIRSVVRQCQQRDIRCFVKQLGRHPIDGEAAPFRTLHTKGGDPQEWPKDLRIREYPQ